MKQLQFGLVELEKKTLLVSLRQQNYLLRGLAVVALLFWYVMIWTYQKFWNDSGTSRLHWLQHAPLGASFAH